MTNFVQYENSDGLELVVNQQTGAVYASISATARMCNVANQRVGEFATSRNFETIPAQIQTSTGLKTSRLLSEDQIGECLAKYNPDLLLKCLKAGIRVYLYGLAGYDIKPQEKQQEKPRLQAVPTRKTLKQSASDLKIFASLFPTVSKERKAIVIAGELAKNFPEMAEVRDQLVALLPSIPVEEQSFTATEIGARLEPTLTARQLNEKLEALGYQESYLTASKKKKWRVTEKGKFHAVIDLITKGDGKPGEQLRWKTSIIGELALTVAQ